MSLWIRLAPQCGASRPVILLGGLVVILHLLLAHASHLGTEHQHQHAAHLAAVDQLLAQAVGSRDLDPLALDCPIPTLLAPRPESLPGLLPILVWLASPLVLLGSALRPSLGTGSSPPRPPGPTRQALLQRFLL